MTESIRVRARKFLQEFFNDDDLTTFSFDYFPQVYKDFTQGMLKSQKVRMLVENSEQRGRFDELLAALERERPQGYQEYFAEKRHIVPLEPEVQKWVERNPLQIFISHASQDAELAHRLASDLRTNGWQIWIAPDNIKPGEKWVEAIDRGLMESGVFVLLLTPEAVASSWVKTEMNAAIGMQHRGEIRLFTLNVKPTAISALWGTYQWIAFDAGYDVGLAALLGELEPQEVPQPVVAQPAVIRAPHAVLPEKNEPPAQPVELDTDLPNLAANPPPADSTRPNPLQAVIDRLKTLPRQVLLGIGGVIVLLLLTWILWPDERDTLLAEPTEVAEALPSATVAAEVAQTPTKTLMPTVEPTATMTATPSSTPSQAPTITLTPSQTPSATPTLDPDIPPPNVALGDTWLRPVDNMEMVFVPEGSFLMGSDPDVDALAEDDEFPQRLVFQSSFWIDQTEVTNAQFSAFLNSEGNQQEGGRSWFDLASSGALIEFNGTTYLPKAGFANHPVNYVSWYGAAAYCTSVGGSLPTEAQWEYAARGNDGRIYPWGNEAPTCDLAQFGGCGGGLVQVGSYSPAGDSWVSAADMAGNVWEWVADWYEADYSLLSGKS